MAAKRERTKTPGVYRRGNRYDVSYRDPDNRQRWQSARTYDEARALKRRLDGSVADGSYSAPSRQTVAEYALAWVERHHGNGSRGFSEHTRHEYRRDLTRYLVAFMGRRRLVQVRRGDAKAFVAWLVDDEAQARRHADENARRVLAGERPLRSTGPLRDATIRRLVATAKACFSAAVDEEVRRDNPFARVAIPRRDHELAGADQFGLENEDASVKALTRDELAWLLRVVNPRQRLLCELLAATGLRIGEALVLADQHLHLDGGRPHVKVRRAIRNGKLGPPKSRRTRDVPIPPTLAVALREHLASRPPAPASAAARWGALVFPSGAGTPLHYGNLLYRVLRPAGEEAGVPWVGFHAFRHTFASLHIERGTNVVRLSKLLGHSKPTVTLDVYAHLLEDGVGEPLDVRAELHRPPLTPRPGVGVKRVRELRQATN